MENFALGQQISNGLVRNWKYLESYDFPFKNLNILIVQTQILAPEQNEYRLQMNNLDFTKKPFLMQKY